MVRRGPGRVVTTPDKTQEGGTRAEEARVSSTVPSIPPQRSPSGSPWAGARVRPALPSLPVLSGSALRAQRRDLALDVTRFGCALSTVLMTATTPALHDVALAHLALVLVSAVAVLGDLRGRPVSGLALTAGTVAFWTCCAVLFHDVPGGGSALGVLALVEGAVRYGMVGALASGSVVTAASLLLPQVDSTGTPASPWRSLLLVALLLSAAVWLRSGTERAASRSEQVEAAVADALAALPVGVAVLDAGGAVLHANARMTELLGDGDPVALLRALAPAGALEPLLDGSGPDRVELTTPWRRHLSVGASRTRDAHVVVHVEDVTDLRSERDSLRRQATVDALTGTSTRAAGERAVQAAGGRLAALFVDLDGVKGLNDLHGHAVGDVVLAETGERLRGVLREDDLAVRWGGDEFVLLVQADTPAEADAVAERVRTTLRAPVRLPDGRSVRVTASIGVALTTQSTSGLVERADAAMYAAKRAGGDRVTTASGAVRCAV